MASNLIHTLVDQGVVSEAMLEPAVQPATFDRLMQRVPAEAIDFLAGLVKAIELPSVDTIVRSGVIQNLCGELDPRDHVQAKTGMFLASIAIFGAQSNNSTIDMLTDEWLRAFQPSRYAMARAMTAVTDMATKDAVRGAMHKLVKAGADSNIPVFAKHSFRTEYGKRSVHDITAAGWIAMHHAELLDVIYTEPLQQMPSAAVLTEEAGQHYHSRSSGQPVSLVELMLDNIPVISEAFKSDFEMVEPLSLLIPRLDLESPSIRESIAETIDRAFGADAFYNSRPRRLGVFTLLPHAEFDVESSFSFFGFNCENIMHYAIREGVFLSDIFSNMTPHLQRLNDPMLLKAGGEVQEADLLSTAIGANNHQAFGALLEAGLSLNDNNGLARQHLSKYRGDKRSKFEAIADAHAARQVINAVAQVPACAKPL